MCDWGKTRHGNHPLKEVNTTADVFNFIMLLLFQLLLFQFGYLLELTGRIYVMLMINVSFSDFSHICLVLLHYLSCSHVLHDHRITELWGMKGTSRYHWIQSLLKQVSYSRSHRWIFIISREEESTASLGSLFQCCITLTITLCHPHVHCMMQYKRVGDRYIYIHTQFWLEIF